MHIQGIALYADKEIKTAATLALADIKGVLIYLKNKKKMRTCVYVHNSNLKINQNFVTVNELNASTTHISYNDLHKLSNYFNTTSSDRICVSIINIHDLPKSPFLHNSKFQRVLNNLVNKGTTRYKIDGGCHCGGMCTPGDKAFC